jgi:hypothetical protein
VTFRALSASADLSVWIWKNHAIILKVQVHEKIPFDLFCEDLNKVVFSLQGFVAVDQVCGIDSLFLIVSWEKVCQAKGVPG